MVHRVDLALVGTELSPRERGAGVRQTRVGVELFAIAVAEDFAVRSLASADLRRLLTGQLEDWRSLGHDRGKVVVVVPSQREIAERAARVLILGDSFTPSAVRVADDRHVADQLLRNPGAIAVVRVQDQPPVGMRLVQIDWTAPTLAAFDFGTYPFGVTLNLVTSGQPDERTQRFLELLLTGDDHTLLGHTLLR